MTTQRGTTQRGTTEQAVVRFPLGSFRATVDDGVVRGATFDPTPQPVRRDRFGVHEVLEAYFAGEVGALDTLTVDAKGTPFQQEVWAELRRIPVGSTISYGELARRVGRPKAQRAVGMANASNPVALIVPCHRVIRTGGALGGYAFGLDYKRWLLAHEAPALELLAVQ
jgi:methylated-DNA-[protein]-cysteine S-methyltransferase